MEPRPSPPSWRRFQVEIGDSNPVASSAIFWREATRAATIGIFVLLFIGFLSVARGILLPVVLAIVIGTVLTPIIRVGAEYRVPVAVTAPLLVVLLLLLLYAFVLMMVGPIVDWITNTPELGRQLSAKLQIFERPLAVLRDLRNALAAPLGIDGAGGGMRVDIAGSLFEPALALLTPAIGQLILFFGTLLFFLLGREELRRYMVGSLADRDARLRMLRILNDVERNLSSYLGTLTLINLGVGVVTTGFTWAVGLPNPLLWGVLAFILNYIPYIGPAVMIVILFAVGLVAFPTLTHALIAPAIYLVQVTIEGQFITPSIIGRKLTVNLLAVFLALAFWTWLWGPFGSLLAVPLLIVGLVVVSHVVPNEEPPLPG